MLHLNAAAQNGYPYDDFHLLIGLFPTLLHREPAALACRGPRHRRDAIRHVARSAHPQSRDRRDLRGLRRSARRALRARRARKPPAARRSTARPARRRRPQAAAGCRRSRTTSSPSTRCARRAATAATCIRSSSTSSSRTRLAPRRDFRAVGADRARARERAQKYFRTSRRPSAQVPQPSSSRATSRSPTTSRALRARFSARPHGMLSAEQRASLGQFFEHAAADARAPRRAAPTCRRRRLSSTATFARATSIS